MSLFFTHSSYTQNFVKKEGIIFTSTVIVNSAPTSNSTNLFSLHSGSKVVIIDEIGDWINIRIANGNSGWITQNSIKEL
ncbi:MAG: SH3 domain-containing protein [Flavobacteriales bacterium]|nr:SH3 domain-containing protein [Flavobacteriales bacterium]